MPVALDLVVSNPTALKTAYTHIKVYRAAVAAGPFVEVTGPTRRVPISDQLTIGWIDPTGSETDFYRFTYWNQRTGAESAPSLAAQGMADPALDVLSIEELKINFLTGVDLTDDDGKPYPDSLFRFYIRSAVSWLELRLGIPLRRLVVVGERHDYYREEFQKHQMLFLENIPVISVTAVRIGYPSVPSSFRAYPAEWLQLSSRAAGHLELVPGNGAMVLPFLGSGGLLMPGLFSGGHRSLPGVFEVDYVAGFERGQVPPIMAELVGKYASLGPLNIAGDLVAGAGIASQSLSMDGLSQSVATTNSSTNAGYGARIIEYRKEIKETLALIRAEYQGIKARAV